MKAANDPVDTWADFQKVQEQRIDISLKLAQLRYAYNELKHWIDDPTIPDDIKEELKNFEEEIKKIEDQFAIVDIEYKRLLKEELQ